MKMEKFIAGILCVGALGINIYIGWYICLWGGINILIAAETSTMIFKGIVMIFPVSIIVIGICSAISNFFHQYMYKDKIMDKDNQVLNTFEGNPDEIKKEIKHVTTNFFQLAEEIIDETELESELPKTVKKVDEIVDYIMRKENINDPQKIINRLNDIMKERNLKNRAITISTMQELLDEEDEKEKEINNADSK